MKICPIEGCEKNHSASTHEPTLPDEHDAAWTACTVINARTKLTENGCLEWVGKTNRDGYGILRRGGREVRAHRFSWESSVGPIPDGMLLDHVCSNRKCVNVLHLRVVTNKQNQEHRSALSSSNTSGYRGVNRVDSRQSWRARVKHNGRQYYAGFFPTAELANEAAVELRNRLFTHNDLDRASS